MCLSVAKCRHILTISPIITATTLWRESILSHIDTIAQVSKQPQRIWIKIRYIHWTLYYNQTKPKYTNLFVYLNFNFNRIQHQLWLVGSQYWTDICCSRHKCMPSYLPYHPILVWQDAVPDSLKSTIVYAACTYVISTSWLIVSLVGIQFSDYDLVLFIAVNFHQV